MFHLIFDIVAGLTVFKAIFIGSEFNFHYWLKYGKEYTKWYDRTSRPKFMDRIDPNEISEEILDEHIKDSRGK